MSRNKKLVFKLRECPYQSTWVAFNVYQRLFASGKVNKCMRKEGTVRLKGPSTFDQDIKRIYKIVVQKGLNYFYIGSEPGQMLDSGKTLALRKIFNRELSNRRTEEIRMVKFLDRSYNATIPNDPQDIDADGSEENHTGAVPSLISLGIITNCDSVNVCTITGVGNWYF